MAAHSSILAWRIPKSLVGYSPWGHKVRHDLASKHVCVSNTEDHCKNSRVGFLVSVAEGHCKNQRVDTCKVLSTVLGP